MKKFKFKLETVHKLRERKVEEKIRELSKVVGHVNKLKNEITENHQMISRSTESFFNIIGQDLNYLRIYDNYVKGLNLRNEQLEKEIYEQNENLETARMAVVAARKESEVIEIIKKNRYKEYHDRILREERSEEDEANLKDVVADRRELHHELPNKDKKPAQKVVRRLPRVKKGPANDYERVLEYNESLKKK